jgi:hypothetical protein
MLPPTGLAALAAAGLDVAPEEPQAANKDRLRRAEATSLVLTALA